ncbi:MAG TPA: cell surface protein SprA [Gemmatimonadales bacterium]
MDARLESRAERSRDESCSPNQTFSLATTCRTFFQPNFDFQFSVLSQGSVAGRFHVDVDYDSRREFDASNDLSLGWRGRPGEILESVEVGNVTFTPPTSRFLTAGIPMGNYGMRAVGRLGAWSVQAIAAQQRGNVVQERVFTVGAQTFQTVEREIDDYELEPRRFFFTVDPALFGSLYPNVDILDPAQMAAARAALPPTHRPARVLVYRLVIGGQPPNPQGPRFRINGDPTSRRGPVYELLRENVDYYMDPSRLWLALVRPLSHNNERLVVAYTVMVGGEERVIPETGGTPDVEYQERDQVANLVWEPRLQPDDPAFRREIRSVYRIGGPDVQRRTVEVSIATGAGGDQEKPLDRVGDTYLQRFGLARRTNSAEFDVENRLWPRPADANVVIGGGQTAPVIRDHFLVLPSAEPFARRGLAGSGGNPVNDTLYRIPGEYLYSAQHPAPAYRIRVRYLTSGGDPGTIALGSIQLREGSERVLLDGRLLRRGLDYELDYGLGILRFLRPAELEDRPREVRVRFEESPFFVSAPTSIFGLTSQVAVGEAGHLAFTAIGQRQRTVFNRPPLGFEAQGSLLAGVSGSFAWDAPALTRMLDGIPGVRASGESSVAVEGEFATSRPLPGATGEAYLESFEGDGGVQPSLLESRWYLGAIPALSPSLAALGGSPLFGLERAATVAWQNNGRNGAGELVTFSIEQIDPQIRSVGGGSFLPEQILWLTLHPLSVGGLFAGGQLDRPAWRIHGAPEGRRWRSVHTALGPTGADLTRAEAIELWTLVDLTPSRAAENPVLVIDLGDVSENSLAFSPDTMRIALLNSAGARDTTYAGKRVQGLDSLDSELDEFTRTFNRARDDTGLPGDVADRVTIVSSQGTVLRDTTSYALCARGTDQLFRLGDPRANCTVRNNRPDSEDLDNDAVLHLDRAAIDAEKIRRYVVDLGDPTQRARVGRCEVQVEGSGPGSRPRCWVQIRIPFGAPTDSLNGGPPLRRVQSLRLTVVSGEGTPDGERIIQPVARLRFVGGTWFKRDDRALVGISGDRPGQGRVTVTTIGTQDRDSTAGLFYESPPGVLDVPDERQTGIEGGRTQVNERSLRLQAVNLAPWERAESYVRFPEGEKSFLGYRELRLWARGRDRGWGADGALHFFVKMGRDAENFYMYRTPIESGPTRNAWEPELRVDLRRLSGLRARLQQLYLAQPGGAVECSGVDSALVANTPVPAGGVRYAVCDDGYLVHAVNPAVSPPNLAAVQELAVGMVRIEGGTDQPLPGDTLEVWVNDLRLGQVESQAGYAGQLSLTVRAGDVGELSLSATRRDPYFRQLTELPGFRTDDDVTAAATVRLDRVLPERLGLDLPVTVRHSLASVAPLYVSGADYAAAGIAGLRTPRARHTSVTATVRRADPDGEGALAPLLDHLSLSATLSDASTRSEFQTGHARDVAATLEYALRAESRAWPLPDWVTGALDRLPWWLENTAGARALRGASLRWNPTELRLSTGLVRSSDMRDIYLRPAESLGDAPRRVHGESDLWRSTATVGFRPLGGLGARVDLTTVRDLRQYGDTSAGSVAATHARGSLFGADIGFERERFMTASVTLEPVVTQWIRPRLEVVTTHDLLRDPDRAPVVLGSDGTYDGDPLSRAMAGDPFLDPRALDPWAIDPETGRPWAERLRLGRRLGNERTVSAGLQLDYAHALAVALDSAGPTGWLVGVLEPLEVSWVRGLRASYDALPWSPGLGFQLGFGGVGDFRHLDGLPATSAGVGTQLIVTQAVRLPYGVTAVARVSRSGARNWTRQPFLEDDDGQRADEGTQLAFPDVTLRWSWRPEVPRGVVTDAGVNARVLHTLQRNVALADAGPLSETRTTLVRSYPLSGSVSWAPGRLTTSGGVSLTLRQDTLPGAVIRSSSREASAEIGRPFRLPPRLGLRSDLRTRASFQQTRTRSVATSLSAAGRESRLVDNGRRAFSLNADADVAEDLTFVLQASRIVTFDENLGRRFAQTVLTAALQMRFFAGPF